MIKLVTRLGLLILLIVIVANVYRSSAAMLNVQMPGQNVELIVKTINPNQVKPSQCTMTVVDMRITSGNNSNNLIIGGSGADTLDGSAGDDCIIGAGGNDTILGGDGADVIFGNGGNDTIYGDRQYIGSYNDLIYGGDGDDTLYGDGSLLGSGNDTIYGEAGNDWINGDGFFASGTDFCDGGSGTNTLINCNP
ncbi:MAG: hypothetical protein J5I90_11905 [Caldilineales bacterium]|nr:hypothetical protein [Caldilineales bacterium]